MNPCDSYHYDRSTRTIDSTYPYILYSLLFIHIDRNTIPIRKQKWKHNQKQNTPRTHPSQLQKVQLEQQLSDYRNERSYVDAQMEAMKIRNSELEKEPLFVDIFRGPSFLWDFCLFCYVLGMFVVFLFFLASTYKNQRQFFWATVGVFMMFQQFWIDLPAFLCINMYQPTLCQVQVSARRTRHWKNVASRKTGAWRKSKSTWRDSEVTLQYISYNTSKKQDEAHEPECRHVCWKTEI